MKNKIYILIILALFTLTGCNVNYDANIQNGKVEENIELKFHIDECPADDFECEQYIEGTKNNYINEGYPAYNYNYTRNGNYVTVYFNYTYNSIEEYFDSKIFGMAFGDKKITKNKITLKELAIPEEDINIEDFKIKIKSDKVLKNTNATTIDKKNNTYIWNFSKKDAGENIEFELVNLKTSKDFDTTTFINIGGIILITLISIIFILLIFFAKKKNVNKV